MVENELIALGERVVERFKKEKLTLSTAESCTGGWLSKIITEISGASEIFMGGVCSYSNEVKQNILDICDSYIYIDMNSSCESLNVGIASAILMWELKK